MSRCYYCARELAGVKSLSSLSETRDHLHPKSKGGTDTVPCCRQCNRMKADMPLAQWKMFMRNNPNWWVTDKPVDDLVERLRAERDALRELLVEARHEWLGSCQIGSARAALRLDVFRSRIDAVVNKGGGDE